MATPSGLEEFCGGTFWDLNTTWYTDNPDFTICFEKTVLVWVPCFYLFLVAPLEIKAYLDSLDRLIPWSFINITKLICSAILLILQVMELGYQIYTSNRAPELVSGNDYLAPSLLLITLLMQTVFVVMEKKRGIQSSGYVAVFWLLMAVCGVFQYRTYFSMYDQKAVETFPFVIYNIQFPVVVIITVLNCFADATPKILGYPRGPKASPVLEASFISKLFFSWLTPLVWRGYKKPIEHSDLYDLTEDNTARSVVEIWSRNWQKSVQKAMSKQKPKTRAEYFKDYNNVEVSQVPEKPFVSVLPTMVRTFGLEFLVGTAMKIISDVLQFVNPQILSLLISYTEDPDIEVWKGYFYALIMFFSTLIMSLLVGQYSIRMYVVGAKMRTGITTSVYRKALKISNAARKESTVGEIVNLMAVDSQRFMDFTTYMNMLISAPLTIGLALYFLYQILGPSSLAGLATLLILIPANGFIGNEMKKLQIEQMKYKDKRVKMMNEILNGMKVLKLYAWEPSFEKQVLELRQKEIKVLKKTAYYNAVMSFLFTCTPFLVTLTMFLTFVYSSSENQLTADIIFVSMSLMNILKLPLFMVPFLLVTGIQTSVSLKRLNKFLNADELDLTAVTSATDEGVDIAIKDASFAWGNEDEDKNILSNINMTVKTGSLVAVVGAVGSGKTSLCSALLGAMYKSKGTVDVKDKMAYVSQQAWIQNKLLKDNILFGTPYDEKRYQDTLHACSLVDDLAILPAGDKTEIGEKGINLSGGQKQRVSLARAVYSDASIYLLDDPLSAVDSHVGKHIFTHVISNDKGMLKGKTRILVTNALTYLPSVDHIVVIDDGTISEQGSYQELVSKQGKFQEFLLKYLAEAEEDEEADPELAALKAQLEQVVDPELIEKVKTVSRVSESEKSTKGSVRKRNVTKPDDAIPIVKKPAVVGETLIAAEKSETGKVKGKVYLQYFKSVGAVIMLLTVLFYIGSQTAIVMSNLWLTKWSEDDNSTVPAIRDKYMGVYGALGVAQAVFVMLATLLMTKGTIVASWDLNKAMLANIMRSGMAFFDITPTGRIVNRFSKDLDTIDTLLPMNLRNLIQFTISVVATFLVIIVATPLFTVVLVPCIGIYYFMQNVYVTTSRQLKRIESVTRSPIYSHFGESVQGTATIRAYGKEEEFILESQNKVDSNQKSYLPSVVSNRWLSIRLEFIGNILTFAAAVFAVLAKQTDISSGVVGLSISYAQSVTLLLYFVVRMAADVETNIVSVERVKEYCETETEAAWEIQNKQTQKDWPEEGVVEFTKFATRYREGLDLVVKDIDITIKSGEKVGIVGRTGAGKSSLTLSLFRIIEAAAGHIIIDGINIAEIGLHNLRSRLTIIPQDPVLFSGTLRFNLDPFDQYSDEAVWVAIELAHLKPFVSELAKGLQHEVTEGGENFSVGQRQLVCLARALLRKTRLLILDEATAAVDLETDDLIQKTIRKEFATCTVITIAHRLNTIMDSDRILVLDKGEVKEFSPPDDLLGDSSSLFYGMAKDAGLV